MPDDAPSIRDRIIDAARQLFLTKGFNGSNLRDIAKKASVSMGGIYHHFGSKEEIYQALLENRPLATDFAHLYELTQKDEFPENLDQIGHSIYELVRTHQDFFRLCYIDVLEFQGRHVAPMIHALRDGFTTQSDALLSKSRDKLREDVRSAVALRCMIDIFLYSYLEEVMLGRSLAEDLGISEGERAGEMARILLRGILKPST